MRVNFSFSARGSIHQTRNTTDYKTDRPNNHQIVREQIRNHPAQSERQHPVPPNVRELHLGNSGCGIQ